MGEISIIRKLILHDPYSSGKKIAQNGPNDLTLRIPPTP